MKKVTAFRKVYIQDEPWSHLKHLADYFAQQGEGVLDNRGSPSLSATLRLLIERAYAEVKPAVVNQPTSEAETTIAPAATKQPTGKPIERFFHPVPKPTGKPARVAHSVDDES